MASSTFPYLSDDPQGYLLFLKDYIRPCTDICTNCKVRCLDNFIKTASAPDLGWNRLSPDERPRPAHSLLDAQLANLGISAANRYGVDLSEDEIDQIFQPAVRRLTLNANWFLVVEAFAAMTAYRGMGRPDRADDPFDQYKLGKKVLWMACPQFTTQELVKHKPSVDLMSNWLWNLGQLLSDGADVYLSSSSLRVSGDEYRDPSCSSEPQPANTALCTCPIFSILNEKHPDAHTGYEWINVVLHTAQKRIEPALLEAWSQPLNDEELLSSSAPYRPLCPGYDCQADTSWQEDQVHKRNNVVDVPQLADVVWDWSVSQITLLGHEEHDKHEEHEENGGGTASGDISSVPSPGEPASPDSDPAPAADPTHPPDSLRPGFLLLTGTPSNSTSINSQFRDIHLDTFPPCRFAHSSSHTQPPPPLPPVKSLFDTAHREYFRNRCLLLEIPLDQNQNTAVGVKPFRQPRLCRNEGAHDTNGFDFRPSSKAQGWTIRHGTIDWESGADYEDRNMRWGPQHMMRQVFDWEGGVFGWELEE
ncbi:hypothetical protein B0H65DRAFT_82705 [Neurospora tetraspora]|uniref:Uncharacterized protein n=1 Tax=Neurospora tetraspora TaxID=94610 RepID=A0AAE0IZY6_9PEZI|nr:hypothetical protein B0H65DRAFT_82705 [Neurospora tetraspora]